MPELYPIERAISVTTPVFIPSTQRVFSTYHKHLRIGFFYIQFIHQPLDDVFSQIIRDVIVRHPGLITRHTGLDLQNCA